MNQILPSAEAGFFDSSQLHKIRKESPSSVGSGINDPFPYPNTTTDESYAFVSSESREQFPDKFNNAWWDASGIINTYGATDAPLVDEQRETGVFHYLGSLGRFSSNYQNSQITDFTIFNPYIHHEYINNVGIAIPYVSTFKASIDWNVYG